MSATSTADALRVIDRARRPFDLMEKNRKAFESMGFGRDPANASGIASTMALIDRSRGPIFDGPSPLKKVGYDGRSVVEKMGWDGRSVVEKAALALEGIGPRLAGTPRGLEGIGPRLAGTPRALEAIGPRLAGIPRGLEGIGPRLADMPRVLEVPTINRRAFGIDTQGVARLARGIEMPTIGRQVLGIDSDAIARIVGGIDTRPAITRIAPALRSFRRVDPFEQVMRLQPLAAEVAAAVSLTPESLIEPAFQEAAHGDDETAAILRTLVGLMREQVSETKLARAQTRRTNQAMVALAVVAALFTVLQFFGYERVSDALESFWDVLTQQRRLL